MEDLKPCPFCGSGEIKIRNIMNGWVCGCGTTDCIGQNFHIRKYETKEKAIEAWNRRANE